MAAGIRPRPKGPKPLLPAPTSGSGGADAGGADAGGADAGGAGTGGAGPAAAAGAASGATATATGFEPDPADRVGARRLGGLGARLGPDTKEDAWMWEGVPPGRQPDPDGTNPGSGATTWATTGVPPSRSCRAAWPPGQGPDA